jgi:hypothetical protein
VGFAAVLVSVNLLAFSGIGAQSPPRWQALHRYSTDDLLEVGWFESSIFRSRYTNEIALADLAPGSTYLVQRPASGPRDLVIARLYGFAGASTVEFDVSTDLPEGFDPTDYVVASGPAINLTPAWAVAMANPEVAGDGGPAEGYLERLWERGRNSGPRGTATTFVVVLWTPQGSSEPVELFIEASLLEEWTA